MTRPAGIPSTTVRTASTKSSSTPVSSMATERIAPLPAARSSWGGKMGTMEPDARRLVVTQAQRIVVKIGSSSLTTPGNGLERGRVDALASVIESVLASGRELVLVSSGAIAAGFSPLGLARRPRDLASQQAAASVGQGLLMQA